MPTRTEVLQKLGNRISKEDRRFTTLRAIAMGLGVSVSQLLKDHLE